MKKATDQRALQRVQALVGTLEGGDPRRRSWRAKKLFAITRQAHDGLNQQAIAAIENAMLDIKARSLGVPVYDLLGGTVRTKLPLY